MNIKLNNILKRLGLSNRDAKDFESCIDNNESIENIYNKTNSLQKNINNLLNDVNKLKYNKDTHVNLSWNNSVYIEIADINLIKDNTIAIKENQYGTFINTWINQLKLNYVNNKVKRYIIFQDVSIANVFNNTVYELYTFKDIPIYITYISDMNIQFTINHTLNINSKNSNFVKEGSHGNYFPNYLQNLDFESITFNLCTKFDTTNNLVHWDTDNSSIKFKLRETT